jgi:3-hydroxybutyryl-CoA dehydrogenase
VTSPPVIAIVGGGLMGHGIAQVFARAGHSVRVYDPAPETLATLRERIRRNLSDLDLEVASADRVTGHAHLAEALAGS